MLLAGMATARAASGDLDPTFGVGGLAVTDFPSSSGSAAVAVQSDGKIVAVGSASSGFAFAVARYQPNGSLDAGFAGTGKVMTTFGGGSAEASAVALASDGKIVVAGSAAPGGFCCQFALARYNTNGSLDTSFDGDGRVTTVFGGLTSALALAIQSDGKIVAAGSTYNPVGPSGVAIARYNLDGSLDVGFGTLGKVVFGFGGCCDDAASIALQGDGRIVVAGGRGAGGDFTLARLNSDGTLDATFGVGGRVATDFGGFDRANAVAIQRDGQIVAAGDGRERFALARYNADGSLDPTFGSGGKVITSIFAENIESARSVAIQANGKIVAVGSVFHNFSRDFGLVRYNADGSLDPAFGSGGIVTTNFGDRSADAAASVAIQPNGMLVVAGATGPGCGNPCLFSVARYIGDAVDLTAPAIVALQTPLPNANGWNNTTVSVNWTVDDPESGIASSSGCAPITLVGETGGTTLTCSAQNGAGLSSSMSITVRIDETAPSIAFNGNAGAYTVDQTILITCLATDGLSGIATTSCPFVASGPATNYVGTAATTSTTLVATAFDNAGNLTSASTTLTVTVTADGICRLTASLTDAETICEQVTSIASAPNARAHAGKLQAFDNFLDALSGDSIPADMAELLRSLAHLL